MPLTAMPRHDADMEPATLKITLHSGTVWRRILRFRAGGVDGAARDLTGCALAAQIRDLATMAKVAAIEIAPDDLAGGMVSLSINDADRSISSALAAYALGWDLLIIPPSGEPQKLISGPFEIRETMTKL